MMNMQETIYLCSHSLKGVADTGVAQELIKHSIEATERFQSDAKVTSFCCLPISSSSIKKATFLSYTILKKERDSSWYQ